MICYHNENKYRCLICNADAYCKHKKILNDCVQCGGKRTCDHGKIKRHCKECDVGDYAEKKRIRAEKRQHAKRLECALIKQLCPDTDE